MIERSQASWCASFSINADLFEISHHTRVATLGTLDHSLTLYAGIEALTLGADWMYLGDLPPSQQLNSLDVDVIYATPTQMRLLSMRAGERTLLRPKHIVLGGAKLDPTTRATTQDLFPNAKIHEFYGAAECSFITIADEHTPPDSVGRPYPDVEMMIDDDSIIHVKSPYLCSGYLSKGHDLALRDGFVSIDEVGEVDENGYLYLKGRRSGMFTVADQNVFPEEIEQALLQICGVELAAVLPVPDPNRGNRAVAFLAISQNIDSTEFTRLGIRPKDVYRLDSEEWPLLPSQKTDRAALRKRFL
jgi:long-chain acyl-CoA synthetase